jgi:3,4-dihydroxy 2-butanone 4-phosphate synthase / GTP cyclohydrolase II
VLTNLETGMPEKPFCTVEEAFEEIRQGSMVVLVDDADRENEGDLCMAAEKVTPDAINFMARFGRGLVCLSLTEERCEELNLSMMVAQNTSNYGTAFCESIEARRGVTTGISAADRATTILTAIDPKTRPADLARPGHVFPLKAKCGGVLVRAGQTEASVDLARSAGLLPAGVICEIMNDDGTMARVPELVEFCRRHGLKLLTIADLIRHRMQHERHMHRVAEGALPTRYGEFRMIVFRSEADEELHVALVRGELAAADDAEPPLVRLHSHCLTGDVLHSTACDCAELIEHSLERIAAEGRGVFVYLHHRGRGFGVDSSGAAEGQMPRLRYHKRDQLDSDLDRQRMVQRESGIGVQILLDLGLSKVRVLTNHPRKVVALDGYGLSIASQVPIPVGSAAGPSGARGTRKPTHQLL